MAGMKEFLERAEKVQPYDEVDGEKIVSFSDFQALGVQDQIEGRDLGVRKMNPDGTVASSRHPFVAVNPDKAYANRYVMSGKTLKIVTDYRAISEQAKGQIYATKLQVYEIVRNADTKKLEVKAVSTVTDKEFIEKFNRELDMQSYLQVKAAIMEYLTNTTEVGKDTLSI